MVDITHFDGDAPGPLGLCLRPYWLHALWIEPGMRHCCILLRFHWAINYRLWFSLCRWRSHKLTLILKWSLHTPLWTVSQQTCAIYRNYWKLLCGWPFFMVTNDLFSS